MIAYTCDNAKGHHGGVCIRYSVSKDEDGHVVHLVPSERSADVLARDGHWTFYVGGNVVSEYNLDSLNAKSE